MVETLLVPAIRSSVELNPLAPMLVRIQRLSLVMVAVVVAAMVERSPPDEIEPPGSDLTD
jgi:hypothetical protein